MTNKPIKNVEITVMSSASIGSKYIIEKISNSNRLEISEVMEELQILYMQEKEVNYQEFLENKGVQLETIISSDGINEKKEVFYDYNFVD